MTHEADLLTAQAEAIVEALRAETGNTTWQMVIPSDPHNDWRRNLLSDEAAITLYNGSGSHAGKLVVSALDARGQMLGYYDYRSYTKEIRVSTTRTAGAVARDIANRLLGDARMIFAMSQGKYELQEREADRLREVINTLKDRLRGAPGYTSSNGDKPHVFGYRPSNTDVSVGSVEVEVRVGARKLPGADTTDDVHLTLKWLPVELADNLLLVVAAYYSECPNGYRPNSNI